MRFNLGEHVKVDCPIYGSRERQIGRIVGITYRHSSYVNGITGYTVKFNDSYSVEQCVEGQLIKLSEEERDKLMVDIL